MAPRKLTQIERWIGTEAERLALDASGFSPGSTFFERDTGSMYKWDGTSWGKEIITVADIAGIKTAIESLDNKELATELTLAQILTILGGTAADIGTLKLENGQIKGYDGTDWQPVRVNDEGNLKVSLSGTIPVIYISRLEDRPSATEVEIGQFVILTDEELSTWVSNGVNWVEVL